MGSTKRRSKSNSKKTEQAKDVNEKPKKKETARTEGQPFPFKLVISSQTLPGEASSGRLSTLNPNP